MSPRSWSTASSRVAQLVHRRMAVCSSSTLAQMDTAYFSRSLASSRLGKMGNCWLVGEAAKKGNPASLQAAAMR